eukprot:Lankesteria_metandrocarpae@DN5053_c0_g1_i1.p1
MASPKVTIEYIIELARTAGAIIKEKVNVRTKEIASKQSDADLVTETDVAVEKLLKSRITQQYHTHKFLCEESAEKDQRLTDEPTWIIDPIDGTTNFVHTAPLTCVAIAFAEKGVVQLGVVYNPVTEDLFYACLGGGSYSQLAGSTVPIRMQTSSCTQLGNAMLATGFCVSPRHKAQQQKLKQTLADDVVEKLCKIQELSDYNFKAMLLGVREMRAIGSCALSLAYLAAGWVDVYAEIGVKEWDMAAGILMINEAGGAVGKYDGSPIDDMHSRTLIGGANAGLVKQLSQIVKGPPFESADLDNV